MKTNLKNMIRSSEKEAEKYKRYQETTVVLLLFAFLLLGLYAAIMVAVGGDTELPVMPVSTPPTEVVK